MLIERHKSAATLAENLGKAPSQISQHVTKAWSMGSDFARETELCLQLPTGWMDTPSSYAEMQDKPDPMAMALVLMENMPAGVVTAHPRHNSPTGLAFVVLGSMMLLYGVYLLTI